MKQPNVVAKSSVCFYDVFDITFVFYFDIFMFKRIATFGWCFTGEIVGIVIGVFAVGCLTGLIAIVVVNCLRKRYVMI